MSRTGLPWMLPAVLVSIGLLVLSALAPAQLDFTEDRRNSLSELSTQLILAAPELTVEFFRNEQAARRSSILSGLQDRLIRISRETGVSVQIRNTAREQTAAEAERIGLTPLPGDWFGPAAIVPDASQYAGLRLVSTDRERLVPLLTGPSALEYEVARFAWEASRPNHRIGARIMSDTRETGRFDDGLAVLAGRAALGALPAGEVIPEIDLALLIALRDPRREELALLQALVERGTPVILLVDTVRLEEGGFAAEPVSMPRLSAWLAARGVSMVAGVIADPDGAPIPLANDPQITEISRRPRYPFWVRPDVADFAEELAPAVGTVDLYWTGMLRGEANSRVLLATPEGSGLIALPGELAPGQEVQAEPLPPGDGALILSLTDAPLIVAADSDWIGPLPRLSGADSNFALLASLVDYALGLEPLIGLRFRDASSGSSAGLVPVGSRLVVVLISAVVAILPGILLIHVRRRWTARELQTLRSRLSSGLPGQVGPSA